MGTLAEAPDGSYAPTETPPRPRREPPGVREPEEASEEPSAAREPQPRSEKPRPRREPKPEEPVSASEPGQLSTYPLYDIDGVEVGMFEAEEWKPRYNDMGLQAMNSPNFNAWQKANAEAFVDVYGETQPATAQQEALGV